MKNNVYIVSSDKKMNINILYITMLIINTNFNIEENNIMPQSKPDLKISKENILKLANIANNNNKTFGFSFFGEAGIGYLLPTITLKNTNEDSLKYLKFFNQHKTSL